MSARAGVIFHEDFASGGLSQNVPGFQWSASGRNNVAVGVDRFGKSHAMLAFTYQAWNSSATSDEKHWAEQRWSIDNGLREFVMSFWLKVPDNFSHDSPSGRHNNKFFMLWCDGYSTKGDGSTVGMEYRPDGGGSSYFYTKNSNGYYTRLGGDTAPTRFITVPQDRGRWMQIVARVRVESAPDAGDGTIEIWRRWQDETDFTKTHDVRNKKIRVPDGGPDGIAHGYLMGYANSGFTETTTFWLDDFIIGTDLQSVGFGSAADPASVRVTPQAPTLMAVQ